MNTERIERIKQQLLVIKDTHPNICNLWLNYIDNKVISLKRSLDECEKLLDQPLEDDPDISSMATAYLLCRVLTENTT